MSHKVECPACTGRADQQGGYHVCERHGVLPYDWVTGHLTREKALDMMSKWGITIPAVKSKRAVGNENRPQAPVGGNVDSLVNQLKSATSPADKRRLRAALRKLGHVGGARG